MNSSEDIPKGERSPLNDQRQQTLQPVAAFQGSLVRNQIGDISRCAAIPDDKTSTSQWIHYFRDGWSDIATWKSAFIEMVASAMLCFLSGLIDTTIGNFKTTQISGYVGVTNVVLLTIFIIAVAPGSGGHINPLITFATMITGLTGFSRGVLYLIGQTLGAGLAGGILRGIFGYERSLEWEGGGCFRDPGTVQASQALLLEIFSSFTLLFLAFGVALDPRQQKLFGPLAGPFAVGMALGIVSFAGSGLVPGYTGASMNPARCFAFAITRRQFRDQWIWWVGPAVGACLQAITYYVAPPYHDNAAPGVD